MDHSAIRRAAAVAVMTGAGLTACGSAHPAQNHPAASAVRTPPAPAQVSIKLAWTHTGKFFGDPQVWYVARVTNPGSTQASVALNANALDASGTVVGSSQPSLPNIPPHSTFDYFGYLGGGGASDAKLTGTPASITVRQAQNAYGAAGSVVQPMLKTSEVQFSQGSHDTYTDAPLSYDMNDKVTNTTGRELTGGVTQQVVLYDASGNVVGGDTGSSDNVPQDLGTGMSYRESWTGIPALRPAVRIVHSVWPAS